MRPRLYLDEDVHHRVALGPRRRGHDVLTTVEAGKAGTSDDDQLAYAASVGRCLFSFNRGDYAQLHAAWLAANRHHAGVVVSRQASIGPVVRALADLLSRASASAIADRLVWLHVA